MPTKKVTKQEAQKRLNERQTGMVAYIQSLVTEGIESGKGTRSMSKLKTTAHKLIKGL